MRYRLTAPPTGFERPGSPPAEAWVSLDTAGHEIPGPLVFEGPAELVEDVREALLASYGFRGRFIEEITTPMDLEIAMSGWQMKPFEPQKQA